MTESFAEMLGDIIEFSIGLAGFSGIVAVYAGRDGRWSPVDRFRSANLISAALIPGFVAFITLGLGIVVDEPAMLWRMASALLGIAVGVTMVPPFTGRRLLPASERRLINPYVFVLLVGGSLLNALVQLVNAAGVVAPPAFAVLYFGLVWQLGVGAIQFARIIFVRPSAADPD